MPQLDIFLHGDEMLNEFPSSAKIIETKEAIKIGALEKGMQTGKPSIGIAFILPDGRIVLGQTSMRLFHLAAKLFAAKYGWQDNDLEGQNRDGASEVIPRNRNNYTSEKRSKTS